MDATGNERIYRMRAKRSGRSLSVWLYAEEARMFKNIKSMTGDTNDNIIKDAIQDLYDKVLQEAVFSVGRKIRSELKKSVPSRVKLKIYYIDLVQILKLELTTPTLLKNELNRLKIPNYSGKVGKWRVSQVKTLLQLSD